MPAVEDVSLTVGAGETVCLVGESGSGKTVTALSIARLVPSPPARYATGEILLEGSDVLKMSGRELRRVRGRLVSFVFQDPGSSLNPVYRIGTQVLEVLRLHRPEVADRAEVARLLKRVGIPAAESRANDYPHQLSGGMQQRVMIAMALASQPKLLVADEPTTALDVTIQAQILDLFEELKRTLGMSMLFITHNLPIVTEIADRVVVMYAGQVVESGEASSVLGSPRHPYTRALLRSVPVLGGEATRLISIAGGVPQLGKMPTGCRFHPRCEQALPSCAADRPGLLELGDRGQVRCPYWESVNESGREAVEERAGKAGGA